MDSVVISSPGARTTVVQRAAPVDFPESDRLWKVDKQEEELTGHLGELEESTKERNKEFDEKLAAIEERARRLQEKIMAEGAEREREHKVLMEALQQKLATAVNGTEVWVEEAITVRFVPDLQTQEGRVVSDEARAHEFINVAVPLVIENQSGTVTRKLQKAHETFDIENAKIHKRELKIVKRLEEHVGHTAQSLEDEKATRLSKLWLLGEDIEETERMDDRAEEVVTVRTIHDIKALQEELKETAAERERKDVLLLDSMIKAQEKLQACIIDTFGTGPQ